MTSKVTASVTTARPRLGVVIADPVIDSEIISPLVDVATTKPVATTVYTEPIVTTSVIIPASNISYISMMFSADIDVSGLYSYKIDSISLTDGKSIELTKSPSESFVVIDGVSHILDKIISDTVGLNDLAVATLVFLRDFADTQSISDSSLIVFAKVSANAVLMSDVLSKEFDQSKSDVVSISELAAKTLAKYLADTFSISDNSYKTASKLFAESQSVADQIIRDISKLLSESVIPSEAIAFDITKSLSDGFAMNDSADATDGLTFSFSISVANVVFTSDAQQRGFEKVRTESVGTSDSGFILQQDYIDLTYFSEDYVGVGYTF